ncbi:SCO2521 family protein [Streptomyces griseorubiginosus]|uniref:SCO2521 family protein n=1 Tax=Streptomyces griseorubiginosus TaxID=67304 RepID=UPI00113FF552|nr:SCO2521 family protein [Streptomyces griseorubiginosus]
MTSARTDAGSVLACGEVRTCLLPTRDPLDETAAVRLLQLRADEPVRVSRHPNRHAASPEVLTGVDCPLPADTGTRMRAVGTVRTRAMLVEGRVLQSSAFFTLADTGTDRRQPWGHYLVRPGVLVPVGRLDEQAVARGFLLGHRPGQLDIGSIAEALTARISRLRVLDHDPPLTTVDTRLRWTAVRTHPDDPPTVLLTTDRDGLRTVELRLPPDTAPDAAAGLCEDLALHDWLLTTVAGKLDGLRTGAAADRTGLGVLGPLVDHLLHLWMPRARVDSVLHPVWDQLDASPGYGRQWRTLTQRIRDRLALLALRALQEVPTPSRPGNIL